MADSIVVIDSSEVREGRLENVKSAVKEMVEFVETHESRPLAYNVYFNPEGTLMTVFQIHPDSQSMEYHMEIAAPVFAKFTELIALRTMDVYGSPSEKLLTQLRRKAEMLGPVHVGLHDLHSGFARFKSP